MTDHEREVRVVLAEKVMGYRYSHDVDGAPVFIWPAGGDALIYDFDPFEWHWAGRVLEKMRAQPHYVWFCFCDDFIGSERRLLFNLSPSSIAESAYVAVRECGEKIP